MLCLGVEALGRIGSPRLKDSVWELSDRARAQKPGATSSFMAVPVASLAAIFMGSGWFTSSERSRETDYQKSADERFERFHLEILSGD